MNKDYVFNTIAGLINASEAIIMSVVVTRVTDLKDAGYLTLAFAVGNLLMCTGKFGIYNYLVTDNKADRRFGSYLFVRIIVVLAMILELTGYCLYCKAFLSYSTDKLIVIVFIALIYAVESFEDLYISYCQYYGKLYVGSQIFIARWIVILLSFSIALLINGSVQISLGISLVMSIVCFGYCLTLVKKVLKRATLIKSSFQDKKETTSDAISIIRATFPLFLAAFLSFYIINASKYSVERFYNSEVLACYGFVSMPVFAIGLLNGFIYHPQLVEISALYDKGERKLFKKRQYKQYLIVALLTVVCVVGAWLIGIRVLSWLYHTDLREYLSELIILVLAGGFLGLSGFQTVILTIMRKQKYVLYGYIPTAILALIITGPVTRTYGTVGAAVSYLMLMVVLCLGYEGCIILGKDVDNSL